MRIAALILSLGLFSLIVGWLSNSPQYQLLGPDTGVVSLSFSHAGQRVEPCRTLTPEQLEELPPNMRVAKDCPRKRRDILVEFRVDGETLYRETLPPSGIWDDGQANVYQRLEVSAGPHRLFIGLRDTDRSTGFDYEHETAIELEPGQHLLIEFHPDKQIFLLR